MPGLSAASGQDRDLEREESRFFVIRGIRRA
jgi:hypothetical protein